MRTWWSCWCYDSVEGFFIGQLQRVCDAVSGERGITGLTRKATRKGPDYDLYEVVNEVRLPGLALTPAEALLLQLGHGAA